MSVASNLPAVRPASSDYGPDLSNARPVKNPVKELDAENWNQAKADIAQIASTIPRVVLRVANSGVATLAASYGLSAAQIAAVAVARLAPGIVTVQVPGLSFYDGFACPRTTGAHAAACAPNSTTPGDTWRVSTSVGGANADMDFLLQLY